ncbi:S-layer homology domain-containing protein [Paenibacillus ginsengarvi]|uniref:S-layer homology domain-containing protein n=1 Tax=Paenibacillus ginsengarvi TaxID=400777 RepID=UPI001F01C3B9|nr:S-layer homology domain-containing protein [Paenibacillus ginsengarvi]
MRTTAALAAALIITSAGVSGLAEAARFQMSYLYAGPAEYISYVDRTDGAMQVVSPSYFDLGPDGSLLLTDMVDPSFVSDMHKRGIRVVPFLSNHWDRDTGLQALAKRETLATQIAAAVSKYGLDGVNVDIENVTETSRDDFTDLVKRLRENLPADKEVSVAVAANPTGTTKGWLGSYDYAALAKYSDYLMVMAYDESSTGDADPGPVASLSFVERSIRYALRYAPPERIVLGLPFYGRYWKTDGTVNGEGIPGRSVPELVSRYGGTTVYDSASESAVSTFTIPESETQLPVVSYKTLNPGMYTVWHENEQSMKKKLQLVSQYGLKGTGSWSLGQEDASSWSYMTLWVNGAFFADAQNHWAQNEIAAAAAKGWMTGTAEGRFSPETSLTRAEAATILTRSLLPGQAAPAGAAGFADVPATHWASGAIALAKQAGIVDGAGVSVFKPDSSVTRAEMAAMLARALKLSAPPGANAAFSDVRADNWAYPYIQALVAQGALQGYEPGRFRPDEPISRAQMAAILDRLSSVIPAK